MTASQQRSQDVAKVFKVVAVLQVYGCCWNALHVFGLPGQQPRTASTGIVAAAATIDADGIIAVAAAAAGSIMAAATTAAAPAPLFLSMLCWCCHHRVCAGTIPMLYIMVQ